MGAASFDPHVDLKRPVDASARIRGLDALRGVALPGISGAGSKRTAKVNAAMATRAANELAET